MKILVDDQVVYDSESEDPANGLHDLDTPILDKAYEVFSVLARISDETLTSRWYNS